MVNKNLSQTASSPSLRVTSLLLQLNISHLIGDHASGLTKEETTETMDSSPKTKGLQPCPRH